eukprot:3423151-Pleurochrysis_carterae.AAC.1
MSAIVTVAIYRSSAMTTGVVRTSKIRVFGKSAIKNTRNSLTPLLPDRHAGQQGCLQGSAAQAAVAHAIKQIGV